MNKYDLGGTQEVARELGLSDARIGQLRRAGLMPEPVVSLAATPVWDMAEIRAWKGSRVKGKPGRRKAD